MRTRVPRDPNHEAGAVGEMRREDVVWTVILSKDILNGVESRLKCCV